LEKVYQNALLIELQNSGLSAVKEQPIEVRYSDILVGQYFADIVVNDLIILEIKATKSLLAEHEAQLLNYLKATSFEVGLLLNFGPKPKVMRKAMSAII